MFQGPCRHSLLWRARLTGSADIFAARWDGGLPGGLAAGRRPAYGLNSVNYLGRVRTIAAYLGPAS